MFKIEKGIPIKSSYKRGSGRSSVYPFRKMEVGDSFFVKIDLDSSVDPKIQKRKVFAASTYMNRETKMKFIVRSVEGGLRVWRKH